MMKAVLSLLFVVISNGLIAQTVDFKYVKRTESVRITKKHNRISASAEVYERSRFLTANMLFLAKKSISYDKFRTINDLKATTFLKNGQKKEVEYFETKDELGGMLFYSDNKLREFTFPNVEAGAEIETSYEEEYSEEMPFSTIFTFGSYFPVEQATFSVEFPKDVEIGFKEFNFEGLDIVLSKSSNKKSNIYTWKALNVPGIQTDNGFDSDYESSIYYIPHVVVYIKNYHVDGEKVSVLNDASDLYRWYTSLIGRIDEKDLEPVQKLAEELVEGKDSDAEKVEAIYNWVQDNITYVAFGDGFGGFVPRGSASVCEKRYGDCKDMSHLLYTMLNHVGVQTYHAWIGSRRKPYTYDNNPTPFTDDHMIALAIVGEDSVFLDGTDSYVNYGYPSSFTQGKEALVGISNSRYIIKEVPVMTPNDNTSRVITSISIGDGELKATEERVLNGYEKTEFVSDYERKKNEVTDEEYLNNKLRLGNNKTRYSDIKIKGLENDYSELSLSYQLLIQNYYREIGSKTFINMSIDKSLGNSTIDTESRKYGKKFKHKFSRNYITKLVIPEGYATQSIPEKVTFDAEDFGFEVSYELVQDELIQNKHLYVNTLHVKPEDFGRWNDFIQQLVKAYKKNIVLIKSDK